MTMLTTTENNQAAMGLGYGQARRAPEPVVTPSEFLIRAIDRLGTWLDRARERRQLLALDDRMLADISHDRSQVFREAGKPFWRR